MVSYGSIKYDEIMKIPSFCIILPMYNEVKNASKCINSIIEFLNSEKISCKVIAVNDGSSDGTYELLKKLQKNCPQLQIETHKFNSGYGAAIRTGFKAAINGQFEYAIVMDADGTQDPKYIRRFFKHMRSGIDFIKATRYSKKGRVVGVPWSRRIVSWIGNKLAKLALRTPLTDYTNGFRAIRVELLKKLETKENGFPVLLEEVYLARKLNASFSEVGYTLRVRQNFESQSKFVYSLSVYKKYLLYLFKK